jgi:GNAT superfamily N-acetyltransferase
MNHISSRLYEDEKDFQIILDLMTRVRPPNHIYDYPVKVDIEENLASGIIRANTRLWFDEDQPVAWAYVDPFDNLRFELDPRYEDLIGAEIIEWCTACIRKAHGEKDKAALDASCREDYAQRIAFLKRHGFQPLIDTTVYMMRPLYQPIPEPELPPGFIIRPIAGKHEAEAVAAMHRAAFGTEYMTTESRLVIMSTSEYDPSLDLIVVAPDGLVSANCICSVNEERKIGCTDPISTHPMFRRMGLARALLLTGMKLLRERGMTSAQLGTSGENLAMQKTAGSVGFRIESTTIWFSKEVN